MKQKNLTIIIIVLIALAVGYGLLKQKPAQNIPTAPASLKTPVSVETETAMSQVYENGEIGVSFHYPENANIRYNGTSQETGKVFGGTIVLKSNAEILFTRTAESSNKSRGGDISDTLGYEKTNDEYFVKFPWGKTKVAPSDFVPINNGKDTAIIVTSSSKDLVLGEGGSLTDNQIVAFVNTGNKNFPGLIFLLTPKGETVNEGDKKIFATILSSTVFK